MDVFFHVNLPQCPVWAQPPLIDCVEKEKGGGVRLCRLEPFVQEMGARGETPVEKFSTLAC